MTATAPVPDPETVPAELRERDQWLMWDADAERKQPHWRGNIGISWSDPGDWHSFEEAYEAAQERESWGIGYVFAADNSRFEAGKYGFLDLDGCFREPRTETPKDWVPPLDEFRDGYGEYSGGEYGAHIPFVGSTPEWWSNPDDDPHEGPEAHANKFCAFTGDVIGSFDADGGVICDDPDPFLLAAYEAWYGEYPELRSVFELDDSELDADAGDGEYNGDEWLTEDDIEDALGYVDPDMGYKSWWAIGRAVQDFDDGPTGKRLYREWSKTGTKWDDDAPKMLDWLWSNSTSGTGTTLGTLIHHARDAGWEMPNPPGADSSSGGSTFIAELDGCYGYWADVSDGGGDAEWEFRDETNFTLDVKAILELDGQKHFDLRLECVNGEQHEMQVEPTTFNEWRKFKKEVVVGTGTVASAKRSNEAFLNDLRRHLDAQDAPELTGVKRLGVHGDEFVTTDGVLGDDGWTDNPAHIPVDLRGPISETLDVAEEADSEEVAQILELLPVSRPTESFVHVLGWFYATAFRPLILDETGQFNHLAVFGETGAGKTMTTKVLSKAFGMGKNGFEPNSTAFVGLLTLSRSRGLPVWFDEYKPAEWSKYERDRFHGNLRKAAAGQWVMKGNKNMETDGHFLSAPVAMTGEQHLQGSAEQRRTIQTQFSTGPTDQPESQHAYFELRDERRLREHARLFYQWVVRQDDDVVRELWESAGDRISDELDVGGIDDLARQGLQTVLFGVDIYRNFAEFVGAEPPELPVWDSLEHLHGDTGSESRTSHIEEFATLVGRAAINEYLEEDTHYTFTSGELRINVSRCHDRVSKFVRDHDLTGVDLFDNSSDYTSRFKEDDADWITCTDQNSPPVSRCVGIDLDTCPYIDRSAVSDDVDGADVASGSELSQAERRELVLEVIDTLCERDNGFKHASTGDIQNAMMDHGVESEQTHHELDELSKSGEIDQPQTGQYATV